MTAKHIRCGMFANQSEKEATEWLLTRLSGLETQNTWVLLSNLSVSQSSSRLADELDIVAIGPSGVHLVEVKHWDKDYLKRNPDRSVEPEADKLNDKARRLKGFLRARCSHDVGFVAGKLLLTRGESEKFLETTGRRVIRGVEVFGRTEWRALLDVDGPLILSDQEVASVCKALEPLSIVALNETLRVFGDYCDLAQVPCAYSPFHQVYRGRRRSTHDRVVLHIYDLTASPDRNAAVLARREFDAVQKLQKSPWLPSLLDSFQYAPAYPGEIAFFSYLDTEAASLGARAKDAAWDTLGRLHTALRCADALLSLHEPEGVQTESPFLHRNINPDSLRIRSNGEPLLTQLQSARIPGATTVARSFPVSSSEQAAFIAPEVIKGGMEAASVASDVYALCATIAILFEEREDPISRSVREAIQGGIAVTPDKRPALRDMRKSLDAVRFATERLTTEPPHQQLEEQLAVAYWDEDTVLPFHDRYYRVVTRLGSGGVGVTFKVVETDKSGAEEKTGPYVAKVFTNPALSDTAVRAYNRVRAQTNAPSLAGVLEVARDWKPDTISALLHWVHGDSLNDLIGILPIYIEDLGEGLAEDVVLRWISDLCEGLVRFHQAGLTHGDVSPRNIIVNGGSVTLTDYDLVAESGSAPLGGTIAYCAPSVEARSALVLSDDIFALSSSMFHALFDREPFEYGDERVKGHGINWDGIDRKDWPRLADFLDRATHPNPTSRFADAREAIEFLCSLQAPENSIQSHTEIPSRTVTPWLDNHVPWLADLLQGYPGSPRGNAETRGLDSDFARATYVETALDQMIAEEIRTHKVSLVILCGNAGDGKTAFLQNLAENLDLPPIVSAQRIWDATLPDGLQIYVNLDGSAAYQGRSANELLDKMFAPFETTEFPSDRVHLVAINDGPLLAWLNEAGSGYLSEQLELGLQAETGEDLDPRIRFVDLNARSLVGGLAPGGGAPHTTFLDTLVNRMLGEESTWTPCQSCSAQSRCTAWNSVQILRDPARGPVVRQRLTRALQAAHQRGEIHITARELRAALTYVFFGVHYCDDLHTDPALVPPAYYDRAFDPYSTHRQGELLLELRLFDPALETYPPIDRELLREGIIDGNRMSLSSLRRRAYFEWPAKRIQLVGGDEGALTLTRGQHLDAFLRVASGTEADRMEVCKDLCEGISRLEDLPALRDERRVEYVPLKITPRTPTETVFWVNKRRDRFGLRPRSPHAVPGLEILPTHLILSYRYENGHEEELLIGAELFHLLMELKDGYQLTDTQSDDIFANLSIFKQRLTQEGDRSLYAWNPQDDRVFEVRITNSDAKQEINLQPTHATE